MKFVEAAGNVRQTRGIPRGRRRSAVRLFARFAPPMKFTSLHSTPMVAGLALLFTTGCQVAPVEQNASVAMNLSQAHNAPANIDPAYTPDGLRQAFAELCRILRYRAVRVQVDQAEFPFLVYGVLEG